MRCSRAIAMAAVLAAISSGSWASAAPKSATERTRQPLGNNPHPVIWSSTKPKPAAPAPPPRASAPANRSRQERADHDRDRHHDDRDRHHPYLHRYVYVPYYAYGYGDGYDPYGLAPPLMDFNDSEQPRPDGGVIQPVRQPAPPEPPEPRAVADRAAKARLNALARKSIDSGDASFAKQKYAEANERYRKAARTAPQLGTAWFRQGFALAAMGRCDLAAAAVKRGLKLDPAWPKSGFELDQLLGPDKLAKNALLDALANAVLDKPADPDRLFVLGVFLHFDGQADRAATLFERAERIAGSNVGHIEAFLEKE